MALKRLLYSFMSTGVLKRAICKLLCEYECIGEINDYSSHL